MKDEKSAADHTLDVTLKRVDELHYQVEELKTQLLTKGNRKNSRPIFKMDSRNLKYFPPMNPLHPGPWNPSNPTQAYGCGWGVREGVSWQIFSGNLPEVV